MHARIRVETKVETKNLSVAPLIPGSANRRHLIAMREYIASPSWAPALTASQASGDEPDFDRWHGQSDYLIAGVSSGLPRLTNDLGVDGMCTHVRLRQIRISE
jgi:hypothetical protein